MKLLVLDMASSLLFLAVLLATRNIYLATGVGIAAGIAQVAWMMWRRDSVEPLRWISLGLVVVMGSATLLTHDPRFIILKPTIIYAAVGAGMLRPGWMARYMPARASGLIPPGLLIFWSYLWAAAMFALAASCLAVAVYAGQRAWAVYTTFAPWAMIAGLMGLSALIFPRIARRNARLLALSAQPNAA